MESRTDVPVLCSTVPDYKTQDRHSMSHIADKRNIITQRAVADSRSSVMFLDSDILVNLDTVDRLQKACESHDVCLAAYQPTWSEKPIVAVGSVAKHQLVSSYELDGDCAPIVAGGTGCTLLKGDALNIRFENYRDANTNVGGDDIGYMRNNEAGMRICALGKYHVTHLAAAAKLF